MEKLDKSSSNSYDSDSNSSDNDDDDLEEDEELVPYRPELENVICQKLTLLIPPESGPKHPRTVYFINDPKLNENLPPKKKYKTVDIKITEKKFMVLYKAYKNLPLCLSGPMKHNKVIRSKLFDNTNIVWKLMKQDKMFPFLKTLNKYQKFNHFPMTWQLSRKDNLYNNYYNMKTKFPDDYNYMPETYVLPRDYEIFIKEKLKDFSLNDKTNLWLLKPCASSRGRGIRLLTDLEDIPKKTIATHYIYNPHLINGKKYDMRLYLLVTGYCPLKIYLFDNGLARFCSEEYDLNPEKMTDSYIHLTNYSINKTSSKFEANDTVDGEFGDKWTLYTLRKYFEKNKLDFNGVWTKIKDIIVKIILSVTDFAIPLIKSFKLSSANLFELYGVDILLDDTLNPWLMEVNLNPSLNCDSQLDLKVKSKLMTDIFNIIGAIPFSHDGKFIPMDKPNEYKNTVEEGIIESLCEFERPTGGFERLFPKKENIKYYSQFIENPEEENLSLWETMLNSK
jgi:hypothetical protein